MQIGYKTIDVIQMRFLRLLSKEAYQNFTYTCVNSAAWFNSQSYKHDIAIKILGENDQEFSYDLPAIKPTIITDGCKVIINQYCHKPKMQ